jgi:acetyl esterase/lipase
MKFLSFLAVALTLFTARLAAADTILPLWPEGVPGLRPDAGPEKDDGQGRYTNIHYPSLVMLPPPDGTANGTAVVYAPGGGYQRVSAGDARGGIRRRSRMLYARSGLCAHAPRNSASRRTISACSVGRRAAI